MKLYLHIGWHKTGTTALQKFLHANREALRSRCAVDYPDTGLHKVAHNLLAWSLHPAMFSRARALPQADPRALLAGMLEEARGRGLERLIVSSEAFSVIPPVRLAPLAAELQGHEVTVLAYVRRQDRYLESIYNQMVKGPQRCSVPFAQFVATRLERGGLDYAAYFGRWAALFGRPSVRVRLYERAKLLEGDIRRDFCQAIGLAAPTGLSFNDAEDNPSLDFDSVQFLSRLNAMQLPEPRRAQLVGILKQRAATQASKSLFAPRERLGIFERFREGNRAFAQEFLGAPDALDLTLDELLADVPLDFGYGRARFVSTLAEVLPRLLPHAAA